jgi:ABC-type uncharacterized transport system auxiliary subunit
MKRRTVLASLSTALLLAGCSETQEEDHYSMHEDTALLEVRVTLPGRSHAFYEPGGRYVG